MTLTKIIKDVDLLKLPVHDDTTWIYMSPQRSTQYRITRVILILSIHIYTNLFLQYTCMNIISERK